MRHRINKVQLNRFTSWRKATLKSMARNLLLQQSMRTTKPKAVAARRVVEKLITLAKKDTLAARRAAFDILGDHNLVKTLFSEIGPRFKNRQSGFTRILHLGARRGDAVELVLFELTEIKKEEKKKAKSVHQEKHSSESSEAEAKDSQEKKPETKTTTQERPPATKKPNKKFLGGLRNIFKKERDSL
jgi:large subunit ribosomal protein L17